jgi:hypothetical protein
MSLEGGSTAGSLRNGKNLSRNFPHSSQSTS